MSRAFNIYAIVTLVYFGLISPAVADEQHKKPNVIVLLLDTLRADHLKCYGYKQDYAPYISSLAREGKVFERAFSTSSWTAPSISSLMTGLYPPQHGVMWGFFIHKQRLKAAQEAGADTSQLRVPRLPEKKATLAEIMKAKGYATFGVSTNINPREETGFTRGFDRFQLFPDVPADQPVAKLEEWKPEILGEKPYFIYAHFNDVHEPYIATNPWYVPESDGLEDMRARYLSELGFLDAQIQKLFSSLNVTPQDLVIILSDHGEEFGDHGGVSHGPKLYVELNRIVCILRGIAIEQGRVQSNVSLIDILPTLCEIVGHPVPGELPGRSLLPLTGTTISDESQEAFRQRVLFAHRLDEYNEGEVVWAATRGLHKLIQWEGKAPRQEHFDHTIDPREQQPLKGDLPPQSQQLEVDLKQFRASSAEATSDVTSIPVDDALVESLESLGYIE